MENPPQARTSTDIEDDPGRARLRVLGTGRRSVPDGDGLPRGRTIEKGIQPVAALPTGLILYDLRVFNHLPPPWFSYEFTDAYQSVKASPEDVHQTRRAGLLGMPQRCNWDAWAGHVKLGTIERPSVPGVAAHAPAGLSATRRCGTCPTADPVSGVRARRR